MKDQFFKLILVTNKNNTPLNRYLDFIASCAEAGITSVQLREKSLNFDDLCEFGKRLQLTLKPFSIPLIINDSVALAHRLGADGVHLGQADGCVIAARKKLGNNKIIGLTVDSLEQLHAANELPINYVGIGAIFPTNNKSNVANIVGCDDLAKIIGLSRHPVVAIGGINETNVSSVMNAGANGVAAIGAFHDARDPKIAAKNLRHIIDEGAHA